MIVNEKNEARINEMIEKVQSRATVRTITMHDVHKAILTIEKRFRVPKKSMEGLEFRIDRHAQYFPKAYKYRPESTQFTLVYRNRHWHIEDISRDYTRAFGHEYVCTNMPDSVKDALLSNFVDFQACCYVPL